MKQNSWLGRIRLTVCKWGTYTSLGHNLGYTFNCVATFKGLVFLHNAIYFFEETFVETVWILKTDEGHTHIYLLNWNGYSYLLVRDWCSTRYACIHNSGGKTRLMPAIQHKRQTNHCTHRLGGPIISHECQTQGLSNSQNWNLCNYRSVKSLKTLLSDLVIVYKRSLKVSWVLYYNAYGRLIKKTRGGKRTQNMASWFQTIVIHNPSSVWN